jgi:glycosyltransferase involved in cell wall biosynthesis
MDPLRILIVVPTLDRGGVEVDLIRVLPRLERSKIRVVVFTFLARGALASTLRAAGVEVVGPFIAEYPRWLHRAARVSRALLRRVLCMFPFRGARGGRWRAVRRRLARAVRRMRQLARQRLPRPLLRQARRFIIWCAYLGIGLILAPYVRSRRIDVVHAVLPSAHVVGSLVTLVTDVSYMMSRVSLNWHQRQDRLFYFAERYLLHRRLDAAVCNCAEIVGELEQEGIENQKIHLIHNGIDAEDFLSRLVDANTARNRLGLPRDSIVISVVANFHAYKGHADLLRALARIRHDMPDWRLLLVGRDVGSRLQELRKLSERLVIADRVVFLGERHDVPLILSAADLHVSASHTEGLPNNIIEAMCAGLPVVATAVGGTAELVGHEETGLLVPRGDPDSLGRAVVRLANDAHLRRQWGNAGRDRIVQHFGVERTAEAFQQLYRELGTRHRVQLQQRRARFALLARRLRYVRPAYRLMRDAKVAIVSRLVLPFRLLGNALEAPGAATSSKRDEIYAAGPRTEVAPDRPTMTVDVVIPVRNRALFIAACLDSVRAQTLQPQSVIVVDDGSTDGTAAILRHCARDWPTLRVIHVPHRGVSAARNTGIAASTAQLVAFLDSDDLWHPEKLERQVALFSRDQSAPGIVHCGVVVIDEQGRYLGKEVLLPSKHGNLFDVMLNEFYHILGSCSAVVVRRDLLAQVGGFDESLKIAEDCDLYFRLARVAQIDYVPAALTYLRQHSVSTYLQGLRDDREFVLFQRLRVWNKYVREIQQMDHVRARFRIEAARAAASKLFRPNCSLGLHDRLKGSGMELAESLFVDRRDYAREILRSALSSILELPTRLLPRSRYEGEGNEAVPPSVGTPPSAPLAVRRPAADESILRHPCDPASDVAALVLSVGEALDDAIAHVDRQTYAVREIVEVRNIVPMHRALNASVSQVDAPFFIQVDSDMRLDRHCVESLRAAMDADVGVAVGYLRDALMKTVVGIKLFRTECFSLLQFRDTISPDTDFIDEIAVAGWRTVYVGNARGREDPVTLGEHRPDYTPAYTYIKYLMEGKRYRYRGQPSGLLWHLRELERSPHPSALVAQVGLCRGIFQPISGDELGLARGTGEFILLRDFLDRATPHERSTPADALAPAEGPDLFQNFFQLGAAFFSGSDAVGFAHCMAALGAHDGAKPALLAKIALCQGLLSQTSAGLAADYTRLSAFINDPDLLPALPVADPLSGSWSAPHTAALTIGRTGNETGLSPARSNLVVRPRLGTQQSVRGVQAALAAMARARPPRYAPRPGTVVMVTGNLGVGGSERQTVALVRDLVARGYRVSILAIEEVESGMPSFEGQLRGMGVDIAIARQIAAGDRLGAHSRMRLPDTEALPEWLIDNIASVGWHIERQRPAVVHCWLDHPSIYGGFAGCALGAPRILFQFGSTSTIFRRNVEWAGFWQQSYRALAGNTAVRLLNNSNAGARDYEDWIGLPRGSIGVLYNGFIPSTVRTPSPEETSRFRANLGLPADAVVVGTLMRFAPEKDPHLWLDTASRIVKERPQVRFVIFGYGPLEQEMNTRIEALGLRGSVTLGGPVDDVGLAYSVIDIVLLTSAVEGVPNVAVEAQAAGRPMVVPDVGGTAESVLDGRTGIVARPRSPASLARAVLELIDDLSLRQAVAREGPRFVAARFGLNRMVDETVHHYEVQQRPAVTRRVATL